MKVAFINSQCAGSTGTICASIANSLIVNGNEAKVYYGRFKNLNNPATFFGDGFLRNFVNNLLVFVTGKVGGFHKHATKKLIKYLKEYNPDVIHLHNLHGNYVNFKILFNYLSCFKGKVILTLHDQFMITGHCAITGECNGYKSECKKCPYKSNYPHVLRYKNNCLLNEKKQYLDSIKNLKIVSPSEWLDEIIGITYLRKYPRFVIKNGVNLSNIEKCEFKKKDKIRLLFVASPWASYKGPNDIVALSKMLDLNKYELIVVGRLDKSFKGFPETIKYLGQLNKDELSKVYDSADLFVDPTYEDNFPTVLIEAMGHGLPLIAYNTGGCKEIVTPKVGIIVNERNPKSLFETIMNFDFAKYNKQDVKETAKDFSDKIMIEKYISLYNK